MDYVTVRDLRSTPKQVWEKLSREGRVVLTNNGKPKAVMVEVDSSTLEETLATFEQAQLMRLLGSIHRDSIKNGTDQMSVDEINREIVAARKQKSKAK
jgi:hypothetical protein